jgi:hypothetical protein
VRRSLSRLLLTLVGVTFPLSPCQAATITVNDGGDVITVNGLVTLREAITSIEAGADVNADVAAARSGPYGSSDAIHFAIGSGAKTISPASQLPALSKPMALDGSTQPGFSGVPLITLDGAGAGAAYGLIVSSQAAVSITAVAVQSFHADGILVSNGVPGDVNGDGFVNVADVFYLINTLFAGGPAPMGPADADGDGMLNVADVFYLINALFAGGPAAV